MLACRIGMNTYTMSSRTSVAVGVVVAHCVGTAAAVDVAMCGVAACMHT